MRQHTVGKWQVNEEGRMRWIRFSALAAVGLLGGCVGMAEPSIPGIDNKVTLPHPVKVETVIAAVKCQLGKSIMAINASEKGMRQDSVKKISFYAGTMIFSGTVQVLNENGLTASAVIPFTGYSGSTLGPDLGASIGNTVIEKVTQTYKVNPENANDAACHGDGVEKLDHGKFLSESIEAFYDQFNKPAATGDSVSVTPTNFKIATSLQIVQKINGGIATVISFANPALTTLSAPGLSGDYVRTGLFELTIDLPLNAPKTAEDRRIVYCDISKDGQKKLCVEEEYQAKRYTSLFEALDVAGKRYGEPPSERTIGKYNRNSGSYEPEALPLLVQPEGIPANVPETVPLTENGGVYLGPELGAPSF